MKHGGWLGTVERTLVICVRKRGRGRGRGRGREARVSETWGS